MMFLMRAKIPGVASSGELDPLTLREVSVRLDVVVVAGVVAEVFALVEEVLFTEKPVRRDAIITISVLPVCYECL